MKARTVYLSVFLVFVLLIIIPSVTAKDHTITVCYNCHSNKGLITGEDDDSGTTCDKCHDIKDNIPQLEARHEQICNSCHLVQNKDSYHKTHINVSCQKCHGEDSSSLKIPSVGISNCAGCHIISDKTIHEVHKEKIEKICIYCHGSRPGPNPMSFSSPVPTISKGAEVTKMAYAKVIDYRKYTLLEIFKKLFSSF